MQLNSSAPVYGTDQRSRLIWISSTNRALQAAWPQGKKLQVLPNDFPYPNETNYNQRLGAWLISNGLSPYQKPECLPEAYLEVPSYKHPTNYQTVSNTLNYQIQRSRNASNRPPIFSFLSTN